MVSMWIGNYLKRGGGGGWLSKIRIPQLLLWVVITPCTCARGKVIGCVVVVVVVSTKIIISQDIGV